MLQHIDSNGSTLAVGDYVLIVSRQEWYEGSRSYGYNDPLRAPVPTLYTVEKLCPVQIKINDGCDDCRHYAEAFELMKIDKGDAFERMIMGTLERG